MKKFNWLAGIVCSILLCGSVAFSADYSWHQDGKADLGQETKRWKDGYFSGTIYRDGGLTKNMIQHTFPSTSADDWTLTKAETHADVLEYLVGTTSTTLKAVVPAAYAVPGHQYVVFNNSAGTVTFMVENGTGTTVSSGKVAIYFTDATPDMVEIFEQP